MDSSEDPFIIPELKKLVKYYDVTIIACIRMKNIAFIKRDLKKVIGKEIPVYQYREHRKNLFQMIRSICVCIHPVFLQEIVTIIKSRKMIMGRIWRSYLFFTQSEDFYQWLKREQIIKKGQKGIFYSYWNVYYCLHLALYRNVYSELKFVSRLHGYDLYEYVTPYHWQPFKRKMDSLYDKMVFVSEHGRNYYSEKYAMSDNIKKYPVCRLGVSPQKRNLYKKNRPFLLVSCSTIYELKRVYLIIEALEKIHHIEIQCVHFGDGEDRRETEWLAKKLLGSKENIKYTFMGKTANEKILAYYGENYPSCIINVSRSEGSPVSLQEAVAFGTPVIVTDVGGNSEFVDHNGYLLSTNPTPEQVAEAIEKIATMDKDKYQSMRKNSYQLWENKYNRDKNIREFFDVLEEV